MLSKEQANNGSIWVCEAGDAPSQHDEEKYRLGTCRWGNATANEGERQRKKNKIPILHFLSSRLHALNLLISPVAEWTYT